MITFQTTKADRKLLDLIVVRAASVAVKLELRFDQVTFDMDLTACHTVGCPLDLEKLLNAPLADFVHDVWGINYSINRTSGELEDMFHPRCALPQQ